MGRQTSQYSLCICMTLFTFYMVNSTFYTVNFLLFIWSTQLFIWSVWKCRLQTGGKMQNENCRSGVKCRLGSWRINRLWSQYRPNREAQERSVKRLEASNTEHRFQDHAYLRSANWTTVREIGFYCPSNRSCRCVMKVYRYIFKGRSKYTWASCMLKLMLLSRTVFSLTREMYLAGCELHIQTVSLLIVLTLK